MQLKLYKIELECAQTLHNKQEPFTRQMTVTALDFNTALAIAGSRIGRAHKDAVIISAIGGQVRKGRVIDANKN